MEPGEQQQTDDLETTDQVAASLRLTRSAIIAWRRKGIGPRFVRLPSGTIRYRRADVEAWIEAHYDGESR